MLFAVSPVNGGMTPGIISYDIRRGLNLDAGAIIEDVSNVIRVVKKSARGHSGRHTVILHPYAYGELFRYTLLTSVRGDEVARGKSRIGDKIGEMVASDRVTLLDDGMDIRGVNASIADDEGVPRQRTTIIERGVLKSFLWNTYWANKMGVKSTGNAHRDMRNGLVDIRTSNVIILPGDRPIQDISGTVKHGYYIRGLQGAHSSNPQSGDFSVVGNPAILIEDGRMVGSVPGLMISGNIYDLLKSTTEIARDPICALSLIGPEMVFEDVTVTVRE